MSFAIDIAEPPMNTLTSAMIAFPTIGEESR
jgi:hypothetical protein